MSRELYGWAYMLVDGPGDGELIRIRVHHHDDPPTWYHLAPRKWSDAPVRVEEMPEVMDEQFTPHVYKREQHCSGPGQPYIWRYRFVPPEEAAGPVAPEHLPASG